MDILYDCNTCVCAGVCRYKVKMDLVAEDIREKILKTIELQDMFGKKKEVYVHENIITSPVTININCKYYRRM